MDEYISRSFEDSSSSLAWCWFVDRYCTKDFGLLVTVGDDWEDVSRRRSSIGMIGGIREGDDVVKREKR